MAMEPDVWSLEARKAPRRLDLTSPWSEGQGEKEHSGLGGPREAWSPCIFVQSLSHKGNALCLCRL